MSGQSKGDKMLTSDIVLRSIDFKKLKEQRLTLLELGDCHCLTAGQRDHLEGLTNLFETLIDALIDDDVIGAEDALLSEEDVDE
jgi:hypothetical protein